MIGETSGIQRAHDLAELAGAVQPLDRGPEGVEDLAVLVAYRSTGEGVSATGVELPDSKGRAIEGASMVERSAARTCRLLRRRRARL